MDKKRLEIILTTVLVIIFIFAWVRVTKVIKKKAIPKPTAATEVTFKKNTEVSSLAQPETVASASGEATDKSPCDDIGWVRCCFSGKFYTSQDGVSSLDLSGILWDEVEPQVVINQEIFKREDKIGNYVIIDIERNKVILSDGEKNLELRLQEY